MNPIPVWVRKIWNAWDIQALVLLSLILQITLFIFGSRRKYVVRTWIRFIVWVAYLMADSVATAALGKLPEAEADSSNILSPTNQLRALWAPLLLLHLGGPDTITAYAYEDNKLWLRHFLVALVQLVLVIYVLLLTWTSSWLSFITFPIFLAGVIKNGERVWALYSSNTGQISLNITNQMEEENLDAGKFILAHQSFATFRPYVLNYISYGEDLEDYWKGFTRSFRAAGLMHLFSRLLNEISSMDIVKLFDVIEIELGFMFDMIYTKAAITYTRLGCILRLSSLFCSLSVLLVFFLILFMKEISSHSYSNIDFCITAVLLVMAVVVELYAMIEVLSSDWTVLWIIKHHKNWCACKIFKFFPRLIAMHKKKRWSKSIGQCSLTSFCFNYRRRLGIILKSFFSFEIRVMLLRWFWPKSFVDVPHSLKKLIKELLSVPPNTPLTVREVLKKHGCSEEITKSCTDLLFYQSIIAWHITTDICYHNTSDPNVGDNNEEKKTNSKILSDYMMYLLLVHPSMFLPATPLDQFRRRDVLESIIRRMIKLFTGDGAANMSEACRLFMRDAFESHGPYYDEVIHRTKQLADGLMGKENKWDIMQSVWAVMLRYAAINSKHIEHVKELRHGGEFLTHLWLLLLHKQVASEGVRMLREE